MEFCSKCDISYDSGGISGCPLCEVKDRIEELEESIDDLEEEISTLEEKP